MSSQILRNRVAEIVRKHGIKAERYLDLGCGDGAFTGAIARIVGASEVFGIDIDDESLQKLPAWISGLKFNLEMLDKMRLPFEDNYFDLVTAVETIEHLSHGDYLMMEVQRVLKAGGYFLLTTPNLASWINRLLLAFGYQPMFTEPSKFYWIGLPVRLRRKKESVYGHKNLYTLRALLEILKVYHLMPCYIGGCNIRNRGLLGFADGLLYRFPSVASILIVLTRKMSNVPTGSR